MTVTADPSGTGGMSGLSVAVTGATGFVGRRFVPALLAEGASVTVVLRTGHGADGFRAMGATAVVADMNDRARMAAALARAEVVVNLAYDLRATGTANLQAFRSMFDASSGARCLVHTSSAVVYDDWPEGPLSENSSAGSPGGGGYRQAKIAMEQLLLQRSGDAMVLQPTVVWGPGSQIWTDGPMNALRGGGLVVPRECGICPALHVDDLVRALLLATASRAPGRERFLISGRGSFRWDELYEAYARLVGRPDALQRIAATELAARLGPDPAQVAAVEEKTPLAALASARLRGLLGRDRFTRWTSAIRRLRPAGGPAFPDRFLLRLMLASPAISTRKAEERLGFVARTGLEDGLATIPVE